MMDSSTTNSDAGETLDGQSVSRGGFLRGLGLATAATTAATAALVGAPDSAEADSALSGSVYYEDAASGLPYALVENIAPAGHRAGALVFFGDNGSGTGGSSNMAWSLGVDTAAATPYRDFFIAKVVGSNVQDLVALYHNGLGAPTIGLGWVTSQPNARVSISAEDSDPTMSVLAIRASTAMTSGNPFEIVNSATGTPQTFYDSAGYWNGMATRSAGGSYPHNNLGMADSNGGAVYEWRHESDGSLSLNYATGGGQVIRATGATAFRVLTSQLGFFGAAPRPRPTPSGAKNENPALASLIGALVSLGLIVDNTA